jgi:hypothetical protein
VSGCRPQGTTTAAAPVKKTQVQAKTATKNVAPKAAAPKRALLAADFLK